MARLPNQWLFTQMTVDTDRLFNPDTKSYVVVGVRDAFEWADGVRTENIIARTVSLMCVKDTEDYGLTKAGNKIENLKFQQFDIKVSNINFNASKGAKVKIDLKNLEKAVGYSNSFGEQVSITFSDIEVVE